VPLPGVPTQHSAVFSSQPRFQVAQVTFAGKTTARTRTAESGNALTFDFCPTCGSTVYWENEGLLDTSLLPSVASATRIFRADHRGMGAITLGLLAARYATQARGEAGLITATTLAHNCLAL
jgi:hypothetical protein